MDVGCTRATAQYLNNKLCWYHISNFKIQFVSVYLFITSFIQSKMAAPLSKDTPNLVGTWNLVRELTYENWMVVIIEIIEQKAFR